MDILDIIAGIQKRAGKDKPVERKINVSEAWYLWDVLVSKYDAAESINILLNFVQDTDLKLVLNSILKHYDRQSKKLEQMLLEHEISLPERPPKSADTAVNLDIFTDKFIFARAYGLFQSFLPLFATAFNYSETPRVKKLFKDLLIAQVEMLDSLLVFGSLKGYFPPVPMYQPQA